MITCNCNRNEGSEDKSRKGFVRILCLLFLSGAVGTGPLFGQTEMKRNRGESYYTTLSSNTEGRGNVWLSVAGIGHVWDDAPIRIDTSGAKVPGFWISNARAFPEVRLQAGLFEFCMVTLESRPITWAAKIPGFVSGDVKFTPPNNKKLRFLGISTTPRTAPRRSVDMWDSCPKAMLRREVFLRAGLLVMWT